MQRAAALAHLIDAFEAGTRSGRAQGGAASDAIARMCCALQQVEGQAHALEPYALPACAHLRAACTAAGKGTSVLRDMADAFQALSPLLRWRSSTRPGSPEFANGHANTVFVGPDGLEQRKDVVLGASLLAPGVTYPMHDHPPEEIYLVLSPGEWFREHRGWYAPGMGGIVHHPPGVVHAMRAGPAPLLAVWCLWTGD